MGTGFPVLSLLEEKLFSGILSKEEKTVMIKDDEKRKKESL
ncbi:MAG: hypothetical protein ACLUUO_07890 [Sellimonas intestinalis]